MTGAPHINVLLPNKQDSTIKQDLRRAEGSNLPSPAFSFATRSQGEKSHDINTYAPYRMP
jgi:hypothetical protein